MLFCFAKLEPFSFTITGNTQNGSQYKHTMDLLHTSLSLKANLGAYEAETRKLCDEKHVLKRLLLGIMGLL